MRNRKIHREKREGGGKKEREGNGRNIYVYIHIHREGKIKSKRYLDSRTGYLFAKQ